MLIAPNRTHLVRTTPEKHPSQMEVQAGSYKASLYSNYGPCRPGDGAGSNGVTSEARKDWTAEPGRDEAKYKLLVEQGHVQRMPVVVAAGYEHYASLFKNGQ